MPHYFNNILCVSKDELVPDHYSYDALMKSLQRHKNKAYGIKRAQKGGNCRMLRIVFDSLSEQIRNAIGDPRKMNHIMEDYYIIDPDAVQFFTSYQLADGRYLPHEKRDLYITNASLIKTLLDIKEAREFQLKTKGKSTRGVMNTVLDDLTSFTPILNHKFKQSHSIPTSIRNFKKTIKNFQNEGFESIVEGYFNNSNSLKKTKKVTQLLDNMFAGQSNKPTATEVSRQYDAFLGGYLEVVNSETGEMWNPKGMPALSVSTIANYLSSWQSSIATHSVRSGDRQVFRQKYVPYHSLEAPKFAGSLLSIDDRQPPFEYAKGKRMWWYLAIDLASEAITVWVYGETKEELITNFYRQLVRQYHDYGMMIPDGLECESSLNSQFQNTILAPGAMFQDVRIEANNARGKRIESWFKPLRYGLEKQREGWIARPFAKAEANQASSAKRQYIPKDRLIKEGLSDIIKWNNMPHSKHGDIARWDYFLQNQHPDLKPTNYKAILPTIGYKTKTSCHAGRVKLQSADWLLGDNGEIYTGENLIRLMRHVEGQDLDVYWLDDNNGSIIRAIAYLAGTSTCICELHPVPTYSRARNERTPEQEEARQTMSAYANTIEGYRKDRTATFDKVHIIDNRIKTISNSFTIPGMETPEPEEHQDVEILETVEDEYDYKPEETTSDRSWRNRF